MVNTDFDDPMVTANDINSDISNDDCLSQSPLNLTRSQGLLNCIHIFINIIHTTENYLILFVYAYIF